MDVGFSARFTGGEADKHRLPAYEAGQSLHGISRSLIVLGHYLATGEVRKRYPFTPQVSIYLHPPRAGSFETLLQIVTDPALLVFGSVLGDVSTNIAANLATDFIRHLYKRTTGQVSQPDTAIVETLENARPGDVEALADAIEPALKLAHASIGPGAQNIFIVNGDNNVVHFNEGTKRYLENERISDQVEEQDISIGSYNVNQRTGRAFFHDLGKTVPFKVLKGSPASTVPALLHSMGEYADKRPPNIRVRFVRTTAGDGTTKRINILDARQF